MRFAALAPMLFMVRVQVVLPVSLIMLGFALKLIVKFVAFVTGEYPPQSDSFTRSCQARGW